MITKVESQAVANVTLSAGDASVAASSLSTSLVQNGEAISAYGLMDTGPGHFVRTGRRNRATKKSM
jgi:hypothetical protein